MNREHDHSRAIRTMGLPLFSLFRRAERGTNINCELLVNFHLPVFFASLFCSSVQHESALIPDQHVKEEYWIYVENHKQIVQLVEQWGVGWGS